MVIVGTPDPAPWTMASGLALALAISASAVLVAEMFGGEPELLRIAVWVYTYVFLGVAAFAQLRAGSAAGVASSDSSPSRALPVAVDPGVYAEVLLLVAFGLAFFEFGRRSAASRSLRPSFRRIRLKRLDVISVASVLAASLYAARVGLRPLLTSRLALDRALGSLGSSDISELVAAGATVPLAVCTGAQLLLLPRKAKLGRKAAVGVMLVLLVLVLNPLSSPRFVVGTFLLGTICLSLMRTRRVRGVSYMAIALVLLLVVVFPYADAFRRSSTGDFSRASLSAQWVTKLDYDSPQQIGRALPLVERDGVYTGRQLLGTFLFFVPRSLWQDKPRPTGQVIAENAGLEYTNLSAPLWAEAYTDGGWPATAAMFFCLGLITKRVDLRMWQRPRDATSIVLTMYLAPYLIVLLRGSLGSVVGRLAVLVAVVFFISRTDSGNGHAQAAGEYD